MCKFLISGYSPVNKPRLVFKTPAELFQSANIHASIEFFQNSTSLKIKKSVLAFKFSNFIWPLLIKFYSD